MGYSKTLEMGDAFEVGGTISWSKGIGTVAADEDFGEITLPAVSSELKYVFVDLIVHYIFSSSAFMNYLQTANNLVVDLHGTPMSCLSFPSGAFYVEYPNTMHTGGRMYGNINVKSKFSSGGTTHVGIVNADAHGNFLNLVGVQPVARVILE